MADPLEVELKYAVRDHSALEQVLGAERLGGLVVGPWRTVVVVDRHLDTPDGAIRQQGFAARLRRTGDETIISLKGAAVDGSGGALHRRTEVEGPASEALDPTSWPASAARDWLLAMIGGAPLHVRFTLRQSRRERELKGIEGWALLSLDDVAVEAEGRRLGRLEVLEIESKGGSEAILEPVARELAASGAVAPEPRTKAALADDLLQRAGLADGPANDEPAPTRAEGPADREGTPGPDSAADREGTPGPDGTAGPDGPAGPEGPRPIRLNVGRSPGIRADDTLAEAGRKALRFQLAKLLDQEAALGARDDPEVVHQARVATRRLRAIWRVFGDAYRPGARRAHVRELRRIAARLGTVRDLDVLLAGLETYADGLRPAEREALEPLRAAWQRERSTAKAALVVALARPDYRRFRAAHLRFVETPGAAARELPATSPTRVRDTATSRIWLAYETLRAYDGTLRWADLGTLHAMRIAAKRLRYALEAFREILGPEAAGLIERVVALQDQLGELHDADVAATLARAFLTARAAGLPAASIEAVGRYLTSREREVSHLRRTVPAVWRPIAAPAFRRSLGRAVSVL